MTLDDVDGPVFGLLVAWLYTKTIADEDPLISLSPRSKTTQSKGFRLAKLWVLGQLLLIPKLQNDAITKLHSVIAQFCAAQLKEVANFVYSGEYVELQKLVADVLAFRIAENQLSEILEQLPPQSVVDVTRSLKKFVELKIPFHERNAASKADKFFVKEVTVSPSRPNPTNSTEEMSQDTSNESANKRQRIVFDLDMIPAISADGE
jgi:hypothetical protein